MEWEVGLSIATVALSVFGALGAVSYRTGARLTSVDAAIKAGAAANENLIRAVEQERGAREASDKELHDRINRHGDRVNAVEKAHAERESATAAILSRLESGLASLKESVERLIEAEAAERRAPPPQPNAIEQLRTVLELQKLLRST